METKQMVMTSPSKPDTAIAAALARAGMNTAECRLRIIATEVLRKHHGNVERALKTFEREIDGDRGLIREALRFYLDRYRLLVGDHLRGDAHSNPVAGQQSNGGRGQLVRDNPTSVAASAAGGGVDHNDRDTRMNSVRPVREPSHAERVAAATVANRIVTVLDSFRVRDGRSIGDVRIGELEGLRAANAMEASLLRQIQRHAVADHDARVRDVIKPDDLQIMIQKASEVADAA
jgi:hypothetical protein